jgi:photosystem II stability/assembly factor-like uncharacterized protein
MRLEKIIPPLALSLAILICSVPRAFAAGPRLVMQYFYDQDKSELHLIDLKFPSAQHGMAAGIVTEGKRSEPTLLITTDGGAHWSLSPLKNLSSKDAPLSLYFVDESQGWMVTERGLWFTSDFGRAWSKTGDIPKGIAKVWFLTNMHGWAIGINKQVIETTDGGKSWTPLEAAKQTPGATVSTVFSAAVFLRNHGIITGWNKPRDFYAHPEWQAPDSRSSGELPGTTIFLETPDGGKTWSSSSGSMFGQLTAVALSLNGTSLALFEFSSRMDTKMVHLPPSEVHRMSLEKGVPDRVFRDEDVQITDVALTTQGTPYLAGRGMVGVVRDNPIPGKLKVMTSSDFTKWTEIPADYRAEAHRAYLAIAEDRDVWVATDTGMILKVQND